MIMKESRGKKKFHIIANPSAGRGRVDKSLPRVKKVLDKMGVTYRIFETARPGQGTEIARSLISREGEEVIVAMGGDGTVREVAAGFLNSESSLGIIPSGFGNDFARSLGIPLNVEKSAKLLTESLSHRVDVGCEGERTFISSVGLGFPTKVMEYQKLGSVFTGSYSFLVSIIKAIFRLESYPIKMIIDGKKREVRSSAILVLNSIYTGGGLKLNPEGRLDDGLLDVLIIGEVTKKDLISNISKAYKGKIMNHPQVRHFRARRVKLIPNEPLAKIIDGDISDSEPVDITVRRKALKVLIPPPI